MGNNLGNRAAQHLSAWVLRGVEAMTSGPSREYRDWLAEIDGRTVSAKKSVNRANWKETNFQNDNLQNKRIEFDRDLAYDPDAPGWIAACLALTIAPRKEIHSVNMLCTGKDAIVISNCNIGDLRLRSQNENDLIKVDMRDCWIGDLVLRLDGSANGAYRFDLKMTNCWIGHFQMTSSTIHTLTMNGGGVLSIGAPPSSERSPIYGNVEMTSVFIPKWDGMYRQNEYGSSPWYNMRHHLISTGNLRPAGLFHTSSLSIDRRNSKLYDIRRWIGAIYEYAGDYGSSVAKPLGWLTAILLACTAIYYGGDGVAVVPDVNLENWREVFNEQLYPSDRCPVCAKMWKAIYLSTSAVLNPLTGLVGARIIEPAGMLWQVVFVLQRMVSLVLLFLWAVAIRRQFRMSG